MAEPVAINTKAARVCVGTAVEHDRALTITPVTERIIDEISIEDDGLVWRFTQLWVDDELIEVDLDWMS